MKNIVFIIIFFSFFITGCSTNQAQKSTDPEPETKIHPKENKLEKAVLSKLKSFYAQQEYTNVILAYNRYEITNSKALTIFIINLFKSF